ncbi:hypothetical protein [Lachnoclostridium sp. Marseille-P6806]|uniref:hypothetical protein n=1 Tax=Lachnoclostridium sp. Marseille-P6806 TaxID=2364793 RepID=UPI00102F6ADF|nr:hypothetical protein [Lachnoclostridium sp. Marseille-P6806]
MDIGCLEVVVARKNSPVMKFLRVLLIMMCIAFAVLGAMGMLAALVVAVACGVGAYFVGRHINVEFEYSYVEKELRVARIMNKEARKSLGSYDLDRMEIGAPIRSYRLENYSRREVKTIDYSSGQEQQPDPRYVIYLEDKKLIIEPDEELIGVLRQTFPHKFYKD